MSVRFIVGRAGSGKTWRCLEAIRARLRQNAAEGCRLLLIVPEQASFQMERALIETPDLPGYTRCEVLSFQRLAYRIFAETGADPRRADQTIGPLGRIMAIRRLIRRERASLRLLDRVADKPGLVQQVAAALDELMRENVQPAALAELVERAEQSNPLTAARMADLTRLYQAYLDYLIDDRLDPAQYLTLAAGRMDACGWLDRAEVWLDGFAGFTQSEYILLSKLTARAASVEITMLVDPSASAIEAAELPRVSYSLFARTERTMVRLRRTLEAAGTALEAPVRLSASPRFRASELGRLERNLFGSRGGSDDDPVSPAVIRVLELPDRRAEVDAAVAEVQRLTREASPPMRYRDMAVIVRDLAAYHDLISAAFQSCGIPCFIDRRQPTAHHPLIELVRGLLAIADDDCRLDSVRLTLKTGLLPLSTSDAALLENYLLASGISGRDRWNEHWPYTRFFKRKGEQGELKPGQQATLDRVNSIRTRWLTAVSPWLDPIADRPELPGRTWADALLACLDYLDAGRQLYAWANEAQADGRSDEADAHRQVWLDFVELLDEFVRALGTEPMGIASFRETIEAGLAAFDLGLAPPTLDQVLVGAIERSRHPAVRAALVLGFDEHHFPMNRSEDPLLGDAERDWLASAGVEIGPSRVRQLLDERMLAYIALTRPSERLWISYPRTDQESKPVEPSPYLRDVMSALPGVQVEKLGDPCAERSTRWLNDVGELGGRLAAELRYRAPADQEPQPTVRAEWNALYNLARQREDWRQTLTRSLAGLKYRNVAALAPGMIDRAVPSPFVASVSELERFAACPFAHFAEYLLRLEPRVQAELGRVDLGTLCHDILERFVYQLVQDQRAFADLEDDQIAEQIDAASRAVAPSMAADVLLTEARNAYLFDRSRGHLQRVARWQRDAARVGRFRPRAVEFPFGFSGHPAAPLRLTTPGGRTILLRGRIDRVDIAELGGELLGLVIDYKRTSGKTLDLTKVYHGLALQLVGYLLALRQTGQSLTGRPIRPVGAFFLPLLEPYQSVPHPSREKKTPYQCRGVADMSALEAVDRTVETNKRSQYFAATIRNDGEPHANSDLAKRDQLVALMAHVGRRMGELADALLDGQIDVRPYRLRRQTPCPWCEYRPVCRYEIETQPPRSLESFKRSDALQRITREQADA